MLEMTSLREQLAAAADDRLRVLVVGAGVAGITLAQLLRRQGLHPVLVDRVGPATDPGYMLALMPVVDPVMDALDVRAAYVAASTPLVRYRLRGHTGRQLREDSLAGLVDRFGDYRGISRAHLLETLAEHGCPVTWRCQPLALEQRGRTVDVRLGEPGGETTAEFDLVVGADGLNSATRDLVLPAAQVERVDAGWGGWVTWTDLDADTDLVEEVWGAGFFIGSYPVRDRLGIILGGPHDHTSRGPAAFVADVRRRLRTVEGRNRAILDAIAALEAQDPYYWALADARANRWSVGSVTLLGDSAAGFLPTAGLGACMAMESAGSLADALADATPDTLEDDLAAHERRQRRRVEAAQDTSRSLARVLFRQSTAVATLRDLAMRLVSIRVALRPVEQLLEERPGGRSATDRAPARPGRP